jgi:hypothetical protein
MTHRCCKGYESKYNGIPLCQMTLLPDLSRLFVNTPIECRGGSSNCESTKLKAVSVEDFQELGVRDYARTTLFLFYISVCSLAKG